MNRRNCRLEGYVITLAALKEFWAAGDWDNYSPTPRLRAAADGSSRRISFKKAVSLHTANSRAGVRAMCTNSRRRMFHTRPDPLQNPREWMVITIKEVPLGWPPHSLGQSHTADLSSLRHPFRALHVRAANFHPGGPRDSAIQTQSSALPPASRRIFLRVASQALQQSPLHDSLRSVELKQPLRR